MDIVYLDGPTDHLIRQNKKGNFVDRNCCLHFVIYEIRATKFETNLTLSKKCITNLLHVLSHYTREEIFKQIN